MRPSLWQRFPNVINCIYTDADDLDMATYHIHTVKGGIAGPLPVSRFETAPVLRLYLPPVRMREIKYLNSNLRGAI